MKKVLQVINSLGVGGAERLCVDLCLLNDDQIQTDVLICKKSHSDFERKVSLANQRLVYAGNWFKLFFYLIWRSHHYQVIHVHLFPAQFVAGLVSLLTFWNQKTHWITTEHNTWNRRRDFPFSLFRPLEIIFYSGYKTIVNISVATMSSTTAWLFPLRKRMKLIYNGIDLPTTKKEFISSSGKCISVGRLNYNKDFPTLIKAISLCPGLSLQIVGEGEERGRLQAMISEYSLEDRVFLLGNRDDVYSLLVQSDIYIQSSVVEGFGLAVLEAMQVGLPVIASDAKGMSEVVDGVAEIFEMSNPQVLADKILEFFAHPEYYKERIQKGIVRSSLYSKKNFLANHKALYCSYD